MGVNKPINYIRFFFKQIEEDSIILWQSKNAIVCGKHQNALAEINLPFAHKNNIDVVRRLSGGGTVYHDLGNLNFTFIQSGEKEKLVDFGRYLKPIIKALAAMGVEAIQGKRNELLVAGKKISGNAEHTFKSRVLHHGTLLYNTDLTTLIKSLRINPLKYESKAIKSVQSRVVNLNQHIKNLSFNSFRNEIKESLMQQFNIANEYKLNEKQVHEIAQLEQEKYRTWDWNFGYSPTYTLKKTLTIKGAQVALEISVKKGQITSINYFENESEFAKDLVAIVGLPHKPETIKPLAHKYGIDFMEFF
ncbi:MAG: lipoate--protein ligase family protein [Bacteroidia bacterium]